MATPDNPTDTAKAPPRNALMQSIGYDLPPKDSNPSVNGVSIVSARWGFCYDVADPVLKVGVNVTLAMTPPISPEGVNGQPAAASVPPSTLLPSNSQPLATACVQLSVSANEEELTALMSWLGSFKGILATANSKKKSSK